MGPKKFLRALLSALFLLIFVIAGFETAWADEVAAGGSVAYVSRYIWRGQDLLADNDPAIQPSVTFTFSRNVSFNVWGSYGFGGPNEKNELDELDFTLSYSGALNKLVSYTVGHTYYTFHTGGLEESQETFAGISFPEAPLNPAVTLYGDWGSDVSRGYYLSVTGSKEFRLGRSQPLTLSLSVGYCDGQWSMEPGISDINIGLSTTKKLGLVTITPSLNYTYVPDKASTAKGTTSPPKINTHNEIWMGVTFGFSP